VTFTFPNVSLRSRRRLGRIDARLAGVPAAPGARARRLPAAAAKVYGSSKPVTEGRDRCERIAAARHTEKRSPNLLVDIATGVAMIYEPADVIAAKAHLRGPGLG
jgi:hypothetical protein